MCRFDLIIWGGPASLFPNTGRLTHGKWTTWTFKFGVRYFNWRAIIPETLLVYDTYVRRYMGDKLLFKWAAIKILHLVVQAVPGGPNITGVRSKAKHLFCSVRYPEDWTDFYDCVSVSYKITSQRKCSKKILRRVKKLVFNYHSYARVYPENLNTAAIIWLFNVKQ